MIFHVLNFEDFSSTSSLVQVPRIQRHLTVQLDMVDGPTTGHFSGVVEGMRVKLHQHGDSVLSESMNQFY